VEPLETPHEATLISRFARLFRGHFDNAAQADADMAAGRGPRAGGGHEHIHCHLQPLHQLSSSLPADGEAKKSFVLASYYADGQPENLFRERIYALSVCSDDAQFGECVRMQIFRVREQTVEALRAAAGDAGRVSWEPDDVADALLIPDCNVYWRWLGERFEGEMRTESIVVHSPVLKRDIIVRDDVALWEGPPGATATHYGATTEGRTWTAATCMGISTTSPIRCSAWPPTTGLPLARRAPRDVTSLVAVQTISPCVAWGGVVACHVLKESSV